jgi:hypothetical protein
VPSSSSAVTATLKKFVAVPMLAIAAQSAFASDWRLIASTDAFDLYADAASYVALPMVKVWVRFSGKPPYRVENGQLQVSGMERWTIDCMNRKIATSDYTGYDANNTAVVTRPGSPDTFHDIAPDSTWDLAASRLCKPDAFE